MNFNDANIERLLEQNDLSEGNMNMDQLIEDAESLQSSSVSSAGIKRGNAPDPSEETPDSDLKGLYKAAGGGASTAKPVSKNNKEAKDAQDDSVADKKAGKTNEDLRIHIDALLKDETNLSEDFRTKASTIFEAAVNERLKSLHEELQSEYDSKLIQANEELKESMTQNLDSFLNYVVEEWMEKNKVSIDRGLRVEVMESFFEGLRKLFMEHNIEVPQEKIDMIDEMGRKQSELEEQNNTLLAKVMSLTEDLSRTRKSFTIAKLSENMSRFERAKFKELVESVSFTDINDFKAKAKLIRESYFTKSNNSNHLQESAPSKPKKTASKTLAESMVEDPLKKANDGIETPNAGGPKNPTLISEASRLLSKGK